MGPPTDLTDKCLDKAVRSHVAMESEEECARGKDAVVYNYICSHGRRQWQGVVQLNANL